MRPIGWTVDRMTEWWLRASWGWLVIIGPVVCYSALLLSSGFFGLTADNPIAFDPVETAGHLRSGAALTLLDVAGRQELALTATLFVLVAAFSILWSLPTIAVRARNPFGGLLGLAIAVGMSGVLYWVFLNSEYNLRIVFANSLLEIADQAGALQEVTIRLALLDIRLFDERLSSSELVQSVHTLVYFFGNAAPWCLIVRTAIASGVEPRQLATETPESLRRRMRALQIAVVLAAANLVMTVVYTNALLGWPAGLYLPEFSLPLAEATARYVTTWGAIGSLLLISALIPAYVAVSRQVDRVAEAQVAAEKGRASTYAERKVWRETHGLAVSGQQVVTVVGAVLAPVLTQPTLDAANRADAEQPAIERSVDGTDLRVR